MSDSVSKQVHDAFWICQNEVKKAGRVIEKAGWALNRDDAWDLLIEMENNPKATIAQKLLRAEATKHGIQQVTARLNLCEWPVIMFTDGPTTVAIDTTKD